MNNQVITKPYAFFSLKFLKAYIITMRPYLFFVSGITGIAGMSFISELSVIKIILLFTAAFFSYGFGQALTDCFQIDTDSISSPYRPLTQGIVSKNQFLILSICGLTFCISVFTIYNLQNIILGTLAGLGLLTYTFFKRRWWAGPFYNAWIVMVLFFMVFLSGMSNFNKINLDLLVLAATAVFFGYANFVLAGYFKDIGADRETGYNTFPVAFGKKPAAYASDVFAILFATSALTVIYYTIQMNTLAYTLPAIIFLLAGSVLLTRAQIKLHRVEKEEQAHGSIELVVHSYILILSGVAVTQKTGWFLFLILFYTAFIVVLKLRPMKNQI
jgi:geranylgeranylglycerol-phosphate geranylgeranyltransferase